MKIVALCFASIFLMTNCSTPKTHHHRVQEAPKALLDRDIFASAILEPRSGSKAQGKAWFKHSPNGIHIIVSVTNASFGLHGIHIHEIGDCSAPDASSAGGHYNPTKLPHGAPDPLKFHVGDLGNIDIDKNGNGTLDIIISSAHFNHKFTDWANIIGKSIVLHSQVDDLKSQPAGNSGDRIACGVIVNE